MECSAAVVVGDIAVRRLKKCQERNNSEEQQPEPPRVGIGLIGPQQFDNFLQAPPLEQSPEFFPDSIARKPAPVIRGQASRNLLAP